MVGRGVSCQVDHEWCFACVVGRWFQLHEKVYCAGQPSADDGAE